jgi:hypothetical protein
MHTGYNTRTRQPVCAALASLASRCLPTDNHDSTDTTHAENDHKSSSRNHDSTLATGRSTHTDSTYHGQDGPASLLDKLSQLNSTTSDSAIPSLLKSTGCVQSSSSSSSENLDWLLIVLGRTRTRTVTSWLVACVIHKGYEWQDTDVCVSAGSWSKCTAARVLDTLCQLRGDAVKRTMFTALAMLRHSENQTNGAGLNGGGSGGVNGHASSRDVDVDLSLMCHSAVPVACLMGGIVRVCTQCPCVFKEIVSASELDQIIVPRYVSEVAAHMSLQREQGADTQSTKARMPADVCKKLASLLLQRSGLISMRDLCRVMALLTPSGLVMRVDGDAQRRAHSKKRKMGVGAADAGDLEMLVSVCVCVCMYDHECVLFIVLVIRNGKWV